MPTDNLGLSETDIALSEINRAEAQVNHIKIRLRFLNALDRWSVNGQGRWFLQ